MTANSEQENTLSLYNGAIAWDTYGNFSANSQIFYLSEITLIPEPNQNESNELDQNSTDKIPSNQSENNDPAQGNPPSPSNNSSSGGGCFLSLIKM